MRDENKRDFKSLMVATMEVYGKAIGAEALRIWWAALSPYEMTAVSSAFSAHMTGTKGRFAPLPADILDMIRGESGHLSPEEAWALALESTDESVTVVWTAEIAEALAVARPCLDRGDKFGAGKAFATAYEKCVRKSSPQPKWTVSAGYDASHRQIALQAAVDAGRLSHESVAHLLPAPEANPVIAGLLTGKAADSTGLDPRWKELGEKLRADQAKAADDREAERLARDAEFAARRNKAMNDLGELSRG